MGLPVLDDPVVEVADVDLRLAHVHVEGRARDGALTVVDLHVVHTWRRPHVDRIIEKLSVSETLGASV